MEPTDETTVSTNTLTAEDIYVAQRQMMEYQKVMVTAAPMEYDKRLLEAIKGITKKPEPLNTIRFKL